MIHKHLLIVLALALALTFVIACDDGGTEPGSERTNMNHDSMMVFSPPGTFLPLTAGTWISRSDMDTVEILKIDEFGSDDFWTPEEEWGQWNVDARLSGSRV